MPMLRFLSILPVLAFALATPALSQPEQKEAQNTKLEIGKDLPGPFQPYNVTGARAGRFHCLVTQTSLDPVVIVFLRDLDFTEPFQTLEAELDNRIAKNPNVRLSSFTVVVSDDLPKVVEEDDKRDELAAKLLALAKAKDLKQVVLCLDSKMDLEKYGLDDNAWATIVLVNRYKVVSLHTLSKEKLTMEKMKEIVDEVAEQFGAKRK